MRHIPRGHQANLCVSTKPGKTWDLWIDPDYSWHENAGEFVIESVTGQYKIQLQMVQPLSRSFYEKYIGKFAKT